MAFFFEYEYRAFLLKSQLQQFEVFPHSASSSNANAQPIALPHFFCTKGIRFHGSKKYVYNNQVTGIHKSNAHPGNSGFCFNILSAADLYVLMQDFVLINSQHTV